MAVCGDWSSWVVLGGTAVQRLFCGGGTEHAFAGLGHARARSVAFVFVSRFSPKELENERRKTHRLPGRGKGKGRGGKGKGNARGRGRPPMISEPGPSGLPGPGGGPAPAAPAGPPAPAPAGRGGGLAPGPPGPPVPGPAGGGGLPPGPPALRPAGPLGPVMPGPDAGRAPGAGPSQSFWWSQLFLFYRTGPAVDGGVTGIQRATYTHTHPIVCRNADSGGS